MKKNSKIFIVIILFFVCFFCVKYKVSYALYRETLNTKVYLSVLDSSSTFRIRFETHGGSSVAPMDVAANSAIGTVPTTAKEGYNFVGWYTQENSGTKLTPNTVISGDITYHARWVKIVCKKAAANTLHTETCQTGGTCTSLGHSINDTLTYGSVPGENSPLPGDAYDCDVNDDGVYSPTTERFYFLRENNGTNDNGVFYHYTSYDENGPMESNYNGHIYTYDAGKTHLPDSTLWSNSALESFNGKVARYASLDDLTVACGTPVYNSAHYFDSCQYLMENTSFQSSSLGRSGIWVDSGSSTYVKIHTGNPDLITTDADSSNAVRPVIEVPFNSIDGYEEKVVYNITFDVNGGEAINHETRYANQQIGTLPTPVKEGYIFLGWFTDTNYTTEVTPTTIVTGNMTIHAQWEEITDNLVYVFRVPGTCTFGGSNVNISSASSDCISTVNTTGSPIDYTSAAYKYIDTGIGLYNEDNYEKDYEVGFTIQAYNATANINQAVLFHDKLENSSLKYPGIVFRKAENTTLEIAQTIEGTKVNNNKLTFTNPVTSTSPINVVIERKDGVVSYSFNGGNMTKLQDINETADYFNHFAWFGAGGTSAAASATTSGAQRYLVGTLSNMYIKLESDNIVTHSVSFNAHGGTASFASKNVRHGSSIGTLPTAEKAGYYFDGWYTEETGGTKITENTVVTGDIEYHAHYKDIYLITFNALGGTLSIPQNTVEVVDGETVTLPTATKTDMVFDGWYTEETGGTKLTGDEVIHADDTYYAHYVNEITVTFDAGSGTASFASKKVGQGMPVGELPTAEWEGHVFDGWYTDNTYTTEVDPDETIINSATTFVAKWNSSNMVARVNGTEYETLAEAINAVPNDVKTTITVLKDVAVTAKLVIPSTKNVELDLQSFTLSSTGPIVLENSGTLEIKNGTITSSSTTNVTIDNKADATLNVTGGTLNAEKKNVITSLGTLNITGGTITCHANSGAVDINGGIANISGGEVSVTGSSNGSIKQAVYNNGGTVNISGTVKLSSNSSTRAAVHNNAGTMNITGGEIVSANYSGVLNGDTMTIGIDDNTIDSSSIIIQGRRYGLEISTGKTVTVYDGLFRGQGTTNNKAISDETLVTLKSGISIVHDTDTIGGAQYDIAYLNSSVVSHSIPFNGGDGTVSPYTSKTLPEGDPIDDLLTATKTNINFLG